MNGRFDVSEMAALVRALDDAADRVNDRAGLVVKKTANDTVRDAQANVPVDTGHLKSTIGHDLDEDGLGFEAGPTASYGADVEFGTTPHEITPSSKQALYWPGAPHPVARVWHPGTSPQPYLLPAFDRRADVAARAFAQVAADIL